MKNITKSELRSIILSVHAIHYDYGEERSKFDETIDKLKEEESQQYEVTAYGNNQRKEDIEKLLSKLIETIA